ncbi:MAG: DUF3160 domain-containing protein [Myxococcales bacterium]|nr:DUF3160 domain-containing protein [Myxococcales bacterium]
MTRAAPSLLTALLALGLALATAGCDPANPAADLDAAVGPGPDARVPDEPLDPGTPIDPPAEDPEAQALIDALAELAGLDAAALLEDHALDRPDVLGFDPLQAQHLDLIEDSFLGFSDSEREALGAHGFVISKRRSFPTHGYGYVSVYMSDLPVYVTADSILYAVHRSYDDILQAIETAALAPELDRLLAGMRDNLTGAAAAAWSATARAHADVFLTVALSALRGERLAPAAEGDPEAISALYDGIQAAQGMYSAEIFGARRRVDFSQFTPRGHYVAEEWEPDAILPRYFKAMMWLGRIDLRLIETQDDGRRVFHRDQLEAALLLGALIDDALRPRFDRIDRTIGAFVGEHDYMVLAELGDLMRDLGAADAAAWPATLAASDDAAIAAAVDAGGYGSQRISSHVMVNGLGTGTMPLNQSFALLGQRYTVDSHVFSNVVYDRVSAEPWRMMPDPLDAAFAALGNDDALPLLEGELTTYPYAPALASMRHLVDAHPETYWSSSLYTLWLDALRALSPGDEVEDPAAHGLPAVVGTEAWGRRVLNTQLASWAELRHDTILYAKQSYTAGAGCEYPDVYVDPYPAFYDRLHAFATLGRGLVAELDFDDANLEARIAAWFDNLAAVSGTLGEMAERQRDGEPHSAESVAFINDAVVERIAGCVADGLSGWYGALFFRSESAIESDPTIADVHTQPTDEGGAPVGRVLHVGTGDARMMIVTVETCMGPRAYVGPVSSYYETITENYDRLTDQRWQQQFRDQADIEWMSDLIVE